MIALLIRIEAVQDSYLSHLVICIG
jgi:hypothetical protein